MKDNTLLYAWASSRILSMAVEKAAPLSVPPISHFIGNDDGGFTL